MSDHEINDEDAFPNFNQSKNSKIDRNLSKTVSQKVPISDPQSRRDDFHDED